MSKVILVGAGGHAKEVLWIAEECGIKVFGVLDDSYTQEKFKGYPVLGKIDECSSFSSCSFLIGVGSPRVRRDIADRVATLSKGAVFPALVHPSAVVSPDAQISEGSIVFPRAVISTEVSVGCHCVINTMASLSHEVVLGDYVTIAPNVSLAGKVEVCELAEVGLGSVVRQGIKISKGSMLGMGGVLVRDLPENQVFVGSPAVFLREIES